MPTISIYCKNCSNVPGMTLTNFELLSEIWEGESMLIPFGPEGDEKKRVTGWTDLLFGNPYPDVVRGAPTTVCIARVRASDGQVGYLVYGGNSGLRIGGKSGYGQPIISIEDENDLPEKERDAFRGC